jgi:hypothetical protein
MEHVVCIREVTNLCDILVRIYKAVSSLRDVGISVTIMLKLTLRKGDVRLWTIYIWPKITVIWCRVVT